MRRAILLSLCLLLVLVSTAGADEPDVAEALQDQSCTVRCGDDTGSGTFIVKEGQVFVLTAAHVVEKNRGKDAKAVKVVILLRDGLREEVGKAEFRASVMAYSPAKGGHDLAVLRVKMGSCAPKKGADFGPEAPVKVGSQVWHIGTLMGKEPQSVVKCQVSGTGRRYDEDEKDIVWDQLNSGACSGSSGGGVFTKEGQFIGVLTCGYRGTAAHFYVPLRRIKEWATERKIEWLLDPKAKVPTDGELKKMKVDD